MGTISALLLAVVLAWAALAKLGDFNRTMAGLVDLGIPRPDLVAKILPVAELAIALLLLLRPGWGGVAAFALLAAFTVVLYVTVRSGRLVPCRCFGGASDAPVSWAQVVRNLWLMAHAALAATISELARPSVVSLLLSGLLIAVGLIAIRATTTAHRLTA